MTCWSSEAAQQRGPTHMPTIPRSWGARPPRALLDAPRVQPFWCTGWPSPAGLFRAFSLFREGAENCTRGGRAPNFNFGFRVKTSPQPSTAPRMPSGINSQPLSVPKFQIRLHKNDDDKSGKQVRVKLTSKVITQRTLTESCNIMKRLSLVLIAVGASVLIIQNAHATLLFEDGFNYSTGGLAGNGAWTGASGNIQVGSTSLTYPGLTDVAIPGNDVTVISGVSAGTTKANFTGTAITSGSIYYSFIAVCTALPTANNYLTSLVPTGGAPSGSADRLAVYVGQQPAGSTFKIGVRNTGIGSGATYATSSLFTLGTTNLFVVEYTFGSGGTVSLFVDPTPGLSQPAANVTVTGGGTDAANLQIVGFKATLLATAGNWTFDTLRIGDTWGDVTPGPV